MKKFLLRTLAAAMAVSVLTVSGPSLGVALAAQEKTAIDSAAYRALHVVCIHNRVSPPMVLMSSYKALITCSATP